MREAQPCNGLRRGRWEGNTGSSSSNSSSNEQVPISEPHLNDHSLTHSSHVPANLRCASGEAFSSRQQRAALSALSRSHFSPASLRQCCTKEHKITPVRSYWPPLSPAVIAVCVSLRMTTQCRWEDLPLSRQLDWRRCHCVSGRCSFPVAACSSSPLMMLAPAAAAFLVSAAAGKGLLPCFRRDAEESRVETIVIT